MPMDKNTLEARRRALVILRSRIEEALLQLAPGDPRGPTLRSRLDDVNEEIRRIDQLLALRKAQAKSSAKSGMPQEGSAESASADHDKAIDGLIDEAAETVEKARSHLKDESEWFW